MLKVSIIIVNLNTHQLLQECLSSIYADRTIPAFEVLVVDNGSRDGSVEMVRRDFPAVRLQVNERNEGFARPNNQAMLRCGGEYFFLLNSDAVVSAGAIRTLVDFMEHHPDAGACGPRLLYPDGRPQPSVKGFPSLWTHFCDMVFIDKVLPRSPLFGRGDMAYFDYGATAEVDHVMAAAFLVRRTMADEVGLFDEQFRIYYNDMDWCYRMRQHGWTIHYVHTAEVVHHLGRTVAVVNREFQFFEELHNNVMLFYQKHYGRGSVALYRVLMAGGFAIRTIGWFLVHAVKRTEHSRMMFRFSRKTLIFALRLPAELPGGDLL